MFLFVCIAISSWAHWLAIWAVKWACGLACLCWRCVRYWRSWWMWSYWSVIVAKLGDGKNDQMRLHAFVFCFLECCYTRVYKRAFGKMKTGARHWYHPSEHIMLLRLIMSMVLTIVMILTRGFTVSFAHYMPYYHPVYFQLEPT